MRVGAYIDGLNLFYGGRSICGRGQPGWRWLDLRQLSQRLIDRRRSWTAQGATLHRIVHCTAFIDGHTNRNRRRDQDRYVAALRQHRSFDELMEGRFQPRLMHAPLATIGSSGRPEVVTSHWPVMVQDSQGNAVPDAVFMVSQLRNEEKGSDVNLASQLLLDVLTQSVDAAIVISNDSDLRFPICESRLRIPVGVVNPSSARLAGDLRGNQSDGVGDHWWYQLDAADFTSCQLPDLVGAYAKPDDW